MVTQEVQFEKVDASLDGLEQPGKVRAFRVACLGDDIDRQPQPVLQLQLEADTFEERQALGGLDQQVDVGASGPVVEPRAEEIDHGRLSRET
jgi:hypothetical protein